MLSKTIMANSVHVHQKFSYIIYLSSFAQIFWYMPIHCSRSHYIMYIIHIMHTHYYIMVCIHSFRTFLYTRPHIFLRNTFESNLSLIPQFVSILIEKCKGNVGEESYKDEMTMDSFTITIAWVSLLILVLVMFLVGIWFCSNHITIFLLHISSSWYFHLTLTWKFCS